MAPPGATRKLIGIGFPGESYPEEIIVSDVIIDGLSRDVRPLQYSVPPQFPLRDVLTIAPLACM